MKILLVAINAKYIHTNPAIHMLKASAGIYRDKVETTEYNINQLPEDIIADLYKRKPDVIAFSCYIWNIEMVKTVIRDIALVLPSAVVFAGGPEVSYDASRVLKDNPEIYGVMAGEGETTFRELCSYYVDNKTQLSEIKGLYYRKDGEIVFTGNRPYTDIDDIPFIYDDISLFENKMIYYESSRGCPFRCSYCLSSIDKKVRLRSLEKVYKELQFFLDNNVPQVKFIDRTFNCNKNHAISIWQYILDHDNGITNFHFEVAADLLCQEEFDIIKKMRPGLIQLEIGVQSTNPLTVKEIKRQMNLERVKENTGIIHSFRNTHQHLDLIAGLPYEDINSFEKSFNEVYAMKPDQLQLGFLKVLKGSYMEEMAEEYGLKYSTRPPYEVFSTRWISYDDIRMLKGIEEMVELYYNSGQFGYTISFLVNQFESPFALYKKLSEDYIENGYDLRKPARSYRYEMLFAFVRKYDSGNEQIYRELLTIDSYLRENCKVRPSFAGDIGDYKNEIRQRERDKRNHIDVFIYTDPFSGLPKKDGSPLYAEFDYSDRSPLDNNACIKEI